MKLTCRFALTVLAIGLTTGCAQNLLEDLNGLNSQEVISEEQIVVLDVNNNIMLTNEKNHQTNFNSKFSIWSDPPPPGSGYTLPVVGAGTATRLGKARLEMNHIITTIPDTEPWNATGNAVITAANGDELYFNYSSTIDVTASPDMKFSGTCVITGGTGPFANAAGSLDFCATHNWNTGIGSATFKGELNY